VPSSPRAPGTRHAGSEIAASSARSARRQPARDEPSASTVQIGRFPDHVAGWGTSRTHTVQPLERGRDGTTGARRRSPCMKPGDAPAWSAACAELGSASGRDRRQVEAEHRDTCCSLDQIHRGRVAGLTSTTAGRLACSTQVDTVQADEPERSVSAWMRSWSSRGSRRALQR